MKAQYRCDMWVNGELKTIMHGEIEKGSIGAIKRAATTLMPSELQKKRWTDRYGGIMGSPVHHKCNNNGYFAINISRFIDLFGGMNV